MIDGEALLQRHFYIGLRTAHIIIFWFIMLKQSEIFIVIVILCLMAIIFHLSKIYEHVRRSAKIQSVEILFTDDVTVLTKREDFLVNNKNKTLWISQLAALLQQDVLEAATGGAL